MLIFARSKAQRRRSPNLLQAIGHDVVRRSRAAALPHLDDVYTLARYLLRDGPNADDAVQECYLRALRYFDTYHGPAMKPWLFAILRRQ